MRPLSSDLGLQVGDHARVGAGAGVARVGVAVETEAEPCSVALEHANGVRAVDLDVLADGLQPVATEPVEDELGHRLLLAGRARDAGQVAAKLRQLVAIDLRKNFFGGILIDGHAFPSPGPDARK